MSRFRPNIFVAAFFIGALILTVLPFLQRRFLRAPEPILSLPTFNFSTADGGLVSSTRLRGVVWLAGFEATPCDDECVQKRERFWAMQKHISDLDGGVTLVLVGVESPESRALVEAFRNGWVQWAQTDAGLTPEEFAHLPGIALVDQDGALRGFWKDEPEGRGNAINAARLLYRVGARP